MGWNASSDKFAISDFNNYIRIWDIVSSQELSIPQKHFYKMVAWNPRKDELAVADADNVIDLLNGENGKKTISFAGHNDQISAVSWNLKGDIIATGGIDNTIKLWAGDSKNPLVSFDAMGDVLQLRWSPDSSSLVSLSDKNEIRIWNVNEKKLQGSVLVNSETMIQDGSLVWSPDGKYIAFYRGFPGGVWSGNAWVIDGKTAQILFKITNPLPFTSIVWNPDGTMLAISDSDNIQIWNTSDLVNPS
jgi:WD40 repeat protein